MSEKVDKFKVQLILRELEEILDFSHHIQGQLNTIDAALTQISGNLLHNLEMKIYRLQDKLKPKDESTLAINEMRSQCCYDD
jgi:hypothetical protein